MTLYDELYFEISAKGEKAEIKKLIRFLKSGELDDFFEDAEEYINLDDNYDSVSDTESTELVFSNDELGIEIDEFDTDEFLEVLCKAGRRLYLKGNLFDVDDEEYSFVSEKGDSYYTNALLVQNFNEDDDKPHEDDDDDSDEE